MRVLICIDDTDTLESKGTGTIADELRILIETKGFGSCGEVTRHQLLLHEDIDYTSHNSSMCFDAVVKEGVLPTLIPELYDHLQRESAEGSDPGLAVADIDSPLINKERLITYGVDAKKIVLTKELAYRTAKENGIYLNEAGGTGAGVIGALAGFGLRLGGNDGEVKGGRESFEKGETYTVAGLKTDGRIQAVCTPEGQEAEDGDRVYIAWKAKPLLMNHKITLLVLPTETAGHWCTMGKEELREYGDLRAVSSGCELFLPDVAEEQVCAPTHSCLNCRYRRWTASGFSCEVKKN